MSGPILSTTIDDNDEEDDMINTETFYDDLVRGLRDAVDMFEQHTEDEMPMNVHSPVEIEYCILDDDPDTARDEFERLTGWICHGWPGASPSDIEIEHRPHENTIQHTAGIKLDGGVVWYRVLWIEKNVDAATESEEEDE